MKCLSLTQPWAELVARGAKKIETRSWPTSYRGPLAIQAAKTFPKDARALLCREPFAPALGANLGVVEGLALGAVVAVVDLIACEAMTPEFLASVLEPERSFGGYSPERYGWVLANARRLAEPVSVRGMLGVFELPATVTAAVAAQIEMPAASSREGGPPSETEGAPAAPRGERTSVVNLHREGYDVYIGRPGKGKAGPFGNPFKDEPLEVFEKWFRERVASDRAFRASVIALRGLRLGCFCKPKRCHGDVIAAWLDGPESRVELPKPEPLTEGPLTDDEAERAAILEFDANLPRAEAERRARELSRGVPRVR